VNFVQWLGLVASAFGNRVRWRSIDYKLDAAGRVIFKRVLAENNESTAVPNLRSEISNRKSEISSLQSEI